MLHCSFFWFEVTITAIIMDAFVVHNMAHAAPNHYGFHPVLLSVLTCGGGKCWLNEWMWQLDTQSYRRRGKTVRGGRLGYMTLTGSKHVISRRCQKKVVDAGNLEQGHLIFLYFLQAPHLYLWQEFAASHWKIQIDICLCFTSFWILCPFLASLLYLETSRVSSRRARGPWHHRLPVCRIFFIPSQPIHHIPAIKSHPSWHPCFSSPTVKHWLQATSFFFSFFFPSPRNEFEWREETEEGFWRNVGGSLNGSSGILFAVFSFHPLLGVLGNTKRPLCSTSDQTWLLNVNLGFDKALESSKTWWWDGLWTSQVLCSISTSFTASAKAGLWLFGNLSSPNILSLLSVSRHSSVLGNLCRKRYHHESLQGWKQCNAMPTE